MTGVQTCALPIWFYLYITTAPSVNSRIFCLGNVTMGTQRVGLTLTTSRTLDLTPGGFTGSTVLSTGQWYRIEVAAQRHATTPNAGADSVAYRINGVTEGTTAATSIAGTWDYSAWGANINTANTGTTGDWYFDDCAINDDTGGAQNSWPGAGSIVVGLPDGTGQYNEPTATGAATNWQAVSENPNDGITTYANCATNSASWAASGSRLMCAVQSASSMGIGANDAVTLVSVGAYFAGATSTACAGLPGLRSGGVDSDVGIARSIGITTVVHLDDADATSWFTPLYTDPSDAGAWTATKIDSVQVGFRATDTSPNVRLSQLFLMAEYVPSKALPPMRSSTRFFRQRW